MAGPHRVLIDLNIIQDVLQARRPHYASSARILAGAETGRLEGLVAAHSVTTLFYLLARSHSPAVARSTLTDLLQFLTVAPVNQATIEQALNLAYEDFEDAVQMMAAVQAGAYCIITCDLRGFRAGPLPALQPAEMLALLQE